MKGEGEGDEAGEPSDGGVGLTPGKEGEEGGREGGGGVQPAVPL